LSPGCSIDIDLEVSWRAEASAKPGSMTIEPPSPTVRSDDVLGHPRGLFVASATEFWDRVSFHGMQALLVLFMVDQLLLPGHVEHIAGFTGVRDVIESVTGTLSTQALATQIFGVYVGLVYLTPVLGGLLGDRLLGRGRTVVLGALLMTGGHFCMASEQLFFVALLLLILGAGCLRGNLLAQAGNLYSFSDRRRADGFQIYSAVVNAGALLAPLISGLLAQTYGWRYGFGFAGFGMLVGLIIYLAGRRYVPPDPPRRTVAERPRLGPQDRRIVCVLLLTLPLLTFFWIAQTQVWNTYNLWARDNVDMMIGGWRMPVPWLQTLDGIGAVGMVPPLVLFWRWQAARGTEPDDIAKIAIGCLLYGTTMVWLAAGGLFADSLGKISLAWVVAFHLFSQIGYLYVHPIAVTLFSRTAPTVVNATLLSVYYLSIFAGSMISGRLGGLYDRLTAAEFWLLHAAIVCTGGILILLFASRLRRGLTRDP
jgi:proton-dependent oligopeptide transporter, POT family